MSIRHRYGHIIIGGDGQLIKGHGYFIILKVSFLYVCLFPLSFLQKVIWKARRINLEICLGSSLLV